MLLYMSSKEASKIKKRRSSVALLLAFVLVISGLPTSAVVLPPEEVQTPTIQPYPIQTDNSEEITSVSQTYISDEVIGEIEELPDLREENVKHFRLADGTFEAIMYAEPVHRKDANGVWQDIDNTLTFIAEKNIQRYATPDLRVAFADYADANKDLFVLNENGYSISMRFVNDLSLKNVVDSETVRPSAMEEPVVKNTAEQRRDKKYEDIREAAVIDNRSSITYDNVDLYTNIEYVLQGNDIKENIIVTAQRNDYRYIFQLNVTGLTAQMDEAGNIRLYDSETGQSKYCIPAPYMYDNEGIYSNDVYYELRLTSTGTYTIAVIADKAWINAEDRALPVTIDPTLILEGSHKDAFTYSTSPNTRYGTSTELWISDTCTTYISIDMLELPSGATFNSATLSVYYYYNAGITNGSLLAGAYQVLGAWNETTITHNNAPTVDSTRLSTAIMEANGSNLESRPELANFDISSLAEKWYSGESINYGIALKRENSTTSTKYSVILKSYESGEFYPFIRVRYTHYIPDGVYAFRASEFDNLWLTIEDDSPFAGKKVQQTKLGLSPASTGVFDRSCLFKISRSGSDYVIRSMLNNSLSFGISDGKIITKTIPSRDSSVPMADRFWISWDGSGFLLKQYAGSEAIKIESESEVDLVTVPDTEADATAHWSLERYTGVHQESVTIYFPVNMNTGVTAKLTPIVWSTRIGYNTPAIEAVPGYTDYATVTWDNSSQSATAVLHQKGQFKIVQHIYNNLKTDSRSWEFTFNIHLLIDEGTYFLGNVAIKEYMQVDDSDLRNNFSTSGAAMELFDLYDYERQRWVIAHIVDGYYKITSYVSGLTVTAPESENKAVTQTAYSDLDTQLWKITSTSTGYMLAPKSNLAYFMVGGNYNGTPESSQVKICSAKANSEDKWILARIGYASDVVPESQLLSEWCWVTVARMFAKHFYPNVTYTQENAVVHVKGKYCDESGDREDAQKAINYYVSNIPNAEIDTVIKENVIYEEDTLVRFLDDGYVVYIARGYYNSTSNPDSRNGGHATLIYGYTVIDSKIWFLVRDPLPQNMGSTYMMSYEKLCYGRDAQPGEYIDSGIWDASIVCDTPYADQTVPYFFNK